MIDQLGNGLLLGIIISVASVALSLLYGVTRIVNFAHGEVIALGAIVTLFFSAPVDSRVLFLERFSPLGMSFVTSVIIAILFCGLFGALLELLLFRPLRKAEVGNIAVLVEAAVRNTVLQLRGIDTMREFMEKQRKAIKKSEA